MQKPTPEKTPPTPPTRVLKHVGPAATVLQQAPKPVQHAFSNAEWEIGSASGPISASAVLENFENAHKIKAPEMPFLGNHVTLLHKRHGVMIKFDAADMLLGSKFDSAEAKEKVSSLVKVRMAQHWKQNTQVPAQFLQEIQSDYDWTFTSNYGGTVLLPTKTARPVRATISPSQPSAATSSISATPEDSSSTSSSSSTTPSSSSPSTSTSSASTPAPITANSASLAGLPSGTVGASSSSSSSSTSSSTKPLMPTSASVTVALRPAEWVKVTNAPWKPTNKEIDYDMLKVRYKRRKCGLEKPHYCCLLFHVFLMISSPLSSSHILHFYLPSSFPHHFTSHLLPRIYLSFTPPLHSTLQRPDPILFYEDIILYEDELHDNGVSRASVKVLALPRVVVSVKDLRYCSL